MKKFFMCLSIVALFFSGCGDKKGSEEVKSESVAAKKPELLFYCGITMVKPIAEIAKIIEERENCTIKITQGGSKDLYASLKNSQKGDLYLPGSLSYRKENLKDGILQDAVLVGYNKASLAVKKGNPKNVKGDLEELFREDLNIVLCSPDSGSIGRETKNILTKYGKYDEAMKKSIYITTDSRNLNKALDQGDADVVINWYATTLWSENKDKVEPIVIDEKYAEKKKLIINLLSFSQNKEIAKKFMDFAASKEGRDIFKKYGFLDEYDYNNIDKDSF